MKLVFGIVINHGFHGLDGSRSKIFPTTSHKCGAGDISRVLTRAAGVATTLTENGTQHHEQHSTEKEHNFF